MNHCASSSLHFSCASGDLEILNDDVEDSHANMNDNACVLVKSCRCMKIFPSSERERHDGNLRGKTAGRP